MVIQFYKVEFKITQFETYKLYVFATRNMS